MLSSDFESSIFFSGTQRKGPTSTSARVFEHSRILFSIDFVYPGIVQCTIKSSKLSSRVCDFDLLRRRFFTGSSAWYSTDGGGDSLHECTAKHSWLFFNGMNWGLVAISYTLAKKITCNRFDEKKFLRTFSRRKNQKTFLIVHLLPPKFTFGIFFEFSQLIRIYFKNEDI